MQTTVLLYYWQNMDESQKEQCLKTMKIGKSAFYEKSKNPGKLKVTEAHAFRDFVRDTFDHEWKIEDVLATVEESTGAIIPRKPQIID